MLAWSFVFFCYKIMISLWQNFSCRLIGDSWDLWQMLRWNFSRSYRCFQSVLNDIFVNQLLSISLSCCFCIRTNCCLCSCFLNHLFVFGGFQNFSIVGFWICVSFLVSALTLKQSFALAAINLKSTEYSGYVPVKTSSSLLDVMDDPP